MLSRAELFSLCASWRSSGAIAKGKQCSAMKRLITALFSLTRSWRPSFVWDVVLGGCTSKFSRICHGPNSFLVFIKISVFPQSFLPEGAINNALSTQSAHTYTRSRGFLTPGLEFVSITRYFWEPWPLPTVSYRFAVFCDIYVCNSFTKLEIWIHIS